MGVLENARNEIGERIINYKKELENELDSVNSSISETLIIFSEAKAEGDTSENAAYTDAIDSLNVLNQRKFSITQAIDDIDSLLASEQTYVSSGTIKPGATFIVERGDTGERFTLRVFRGSVSNIDLGIMSTNSRFYKEAYGRRKGQYVDIRHAVTGQIIKFRILEVL